MKKKLQNDKVKNKNNAGAKCKLTEELHKQFVYLISKGNYILPSCDYINIDHSTYRKWMKTGEADQKNNPDKITKFSKFFQDVTRALAYSEVSIIEKWQRHFETDWHACKDFVARRFPERWANKEYRNIQNKVAIDVTKLSDEELQCVIRGSMPSGMDMEKEEEETE